MVNWSGHSIAQMHNYTSNGLIFEMSVFCISILQTLEKTGEVTQTLAKLQAEFHCSDEMLQQWVLDVKEWAKTGMNKVLHEHCQDSLGPILNHVLPLNPKLVCPFFLLM